MPVPRRGAGKPELTGAAVLPVGTRKLAKEMVIASDLEEARRAERCVLDAVHRCGYGEAATFAIKLALEEGLNNAVTHGNGHDPKKVIKVTYDVDANRAAISIADQGGGFNPAAVPDPRAEENLQKPCGRGIMLMRAYMDEVRFNGQGNEVFLVKRNR